jgi:hypothetical protein
VPADPEQTVTPEELAELRRHLDVNLARLEGRLALLTQRDEISAKEQADLSTRVAAMERGRWPLPAVTAVTSVGVLVVTLWQLLAH